MASHCVSKPYLLYPFISERAGRSLPCLSYCERYYGQHGSADVSSSWFPFLWICAQEWDCYSWSSSVFSFLFAVICSSPSPPTMCQRCLFLHILASVCYLLLFWAWPCWCLTVPLMWFPWRQWHWPFVFHVTVGCFYVCISKMSIQLYSPICFN